jgi:hypothetical protein
MTVQGVLVCHRATESGPHNAEWTYWPTIEEARQAEEALTPCGPYCIGCHSVVSVDVGAPPRVRRSHGLRNRKTSQQAGR